MDRRAFLRTLGIGTATAAVATIAPELVLDPERALWVPGRTTYFDLWRSDVLPSSEAMLLTIDMISREALRMLENNLSFASRINRRYDKPFTIGNTVTIRVPKPLFVYGA